MQACVDQGICVELNLEMGPIDSLTVDSPIKPVAVVPSPDNLDGNRWMFAMTPEQLDSTTFTVLLESRTGPVATKISPGFWAQHYLRQCVEEGIRVVTLNIKHGGDVFNPDYHGLWVHSAECTSKENGPYGIILN